MEQNNTQEMNIQKQTPFLKRIKTLEEKVDNLGKKIETILKALKK